MSILDFDRITLHYPEAFGRRKEDGFIWDFAPFGEIQIGCFERAGYMLDGMVHELTEATLAVLIKQMVGFDHSRMMHLVTVLSLPEYPLTHPSYADAESHLKFH